MVSANLRDAGVAASNAIPSAYFVEDAQSVLFFLRCGMREVRCYVTSKVLAACFGADDEADDSDLVPSMLSAYRTHANTIEQLARRLLAEAHADSRAIVITTSDVFRDMCKGMLSTVPATVYDTEGAT